jgi:hypothetical protein
VKGLINTNSFLSHWFIILYSEKNIKSSEEKCSIFSYKLWYDKKYNDNTRILNHMVQYTELLNYERLCFACYWLQSKQNKKE